MAARRSPRHRAYTQLLTRLARRRSVILGYHGVERRAGPDRWRLQVPADTFEAQIELLLEAGFRFHTVAGFVRAAAGGSPPPGLAAISFDDGMRNNLTVALPILQRLGVPASVYVSSGLIGGQSPWVPGPGGRMLDADEVLALSRAGWEIGAHTVTHADLATLSEEACLAEMTDGRDALERLTGTAVETFAYPFGRYGPAAVRAAERAGFTAALTTGSGRWDRFELTRAMVSAGDPFPLIALKLLDGYEPLLSLPPLRVARTASRTARAALARG
jgi:peptidoglycan/xylan/chitin deacetylase (PgdA/CDA1 family)